MDAEIVQRAKDDTNFKYNASGSYGNEAAFKVQAGVEGGNDQAVESQQTKREFHEAVLKSARDYKNDRRTEISTEEVREDETTAAASFFVRPSMRARTTASLVIG